MVTISKPLAVFFFFARKCPYSSCSQALLFQDPKNPRLHESVLRGEITPEHMATMTTDEMASDEMRQVRERLAKEAFNDHQMTFVSGTNTDQFECSKCKKHNTTYNEVIGIENIR